MLVPLRVCSVCEHIRKNKDMKTAVVALTKGGRDLGRRVAERLAGAEFFELKGPLAASAPGLWRDYEGLVFVMATGIVVRTIAPLLADKQRDPAVVVCDEGGRFAISLLSGHLGGANELARRVAGVLGAEPVITTASDVLGLTALDLWARQLGLTAGDPQDLTGVMGRLVNTGSLCLWSAYPPPPLPPDIHLVDEPARADIVITPREGRAGQGVVFHPKSLVVGIGCKRGVSAERIERVLTGVFRQASLSRHAIRGLASINIKSDERGLLDFARHHGYGIEFFSRERLNEVKNVSGSEVVFRVTGAQAVAEPAAILGAGNGNLLVRKVKCENVTIAVAEVCSPWSAPDPAQSIS